MNWFTADFHLDHERICEYTNRPFKNTAVMNKELIRRYNEYVGNDDLCYIVGDFSLRTEMHKDILANYLVKMNGIKILIFGNHDILKPFSYVDIGFQSAHTSLELDLEYESSMIHVILHHDPCVSCLNREPDTLWICGHVHDLFKKCRNVINVGVDVWDYAPVSQYAVLELFTNQINNL